MNKVLIDENQARNCTVMLYIALSHAAQTTDNAQLCHGAGFTQITFLITETMPTLVSRSTEEAACQLCYCQTFRQHNAPFLHRRNIACTYFNTGHAVNSSQPMLAITDVISCSQFFQTRMLSY